MRFKVVSNIHYITNKGWEYHHGIPTFWVEASSENEAKRIASLVIDSCNTDTLITETIDVMEDEPFCVLSVDETEALYRWAAEEEKDRPLTGYGPKFNAAFDVARAIFKRMRKVMEE